MALNALSRRLARLETRRRSERRGGPCPECGHEPGAPIRWRVNPPRVFQHIDDLLVPDPDDDPSKDICSRVWRVPSPRAMGRDEERD